MCVVMPTTRVPDGGALPGWLTGLPVQALPLVLRQICPVALAAALLGSEGAPSAGAPSRGDPAGALGLGEAPF